MKKNFSTWPTGWPRHLMYPEIPVSDLLAQTARRAPDRIGLIFAGREFSYLRLNRLSDRFAAALAELGLRKGERVAVHLPNSPQFIIAYFGALKAGAVFTPVSPLQKKNEIIRQLRDSGAKILVTLDKFYPVAGEAAADSGVAAIIVASLTPESADAGSSPVIEYSPVKTFLMERLLSENRDKPLVDIDVHADLAHLAYTGGTTGIPKAVMLSHYNVVANALQTACWFHGSGIAVKDGMIEMTYPEGVDPKQDRVAVRDNSLQLTVNPWYHAMGIVSLVNNIFSGTTMVTLPQFEISAYLDAMQTYRPSAVGGAPSLWSYLLNDPRFAQQSRTIRLANSGASPLPRDLLDRLLGTIPGAVCESYGMSECTMFVSSNPPIRGCHRPGSVGLPTFDTKIKIVDPETGEELQTGQEGEICIKGPQVMQGYWNQPQETAAAIRSNWLYSGDIGRLDDDGFLYVTDRKKDMIIYKGYNVYPRELEEVLYRHPAVLHCAVLAKPDSRGGEIPVAFVQLKAGKTSDPPELLSHVNDQVAHYKKVRELHIVDDMPVSGPGKVLKRVLKKRVV